MLTLHVEAANYEELIRVVERKLGLQFSPIASAPAPRQSTPKVREAAVPAPDAPDTVTALEGQDVTVVASGTPASLSSAPAEPRSRRGRKSKQAPAEGPAKGTPEAADPGASASQTTVDNGASVPPVTPPAEGVRDEPPAAAAALAVLSDVDVRNAMKKVDEKHGMQACIDILHKFVVYGADGKAELPTRPVERIKELHPAQYAEVIAECEKAVT